ncbi:MAG TPA: choline/ethanolamine kinase family protein [Pseudonocardia sp.]|nr:choline/ethanolamine kinase family protein [Pseudonocardia sp.]
MTDPEIDELLDSMPCTAGRPRTVEDLSGGLTNRNLKVTTADGVVVVRIPTPGPSLLGIDRDHEYANSVAAAQAGVGAPVLHYRPGIGLAVGFLPGRTLSDADLQDPDVLRRVAVACRQLHAGPRFGNEFDMFEVQARYRRIVADNGFRLPPRYDEFVPLVERIREALGPRDGTVPCNNDLLAENLLDDGERVRIIDYEYSGNNDPCFELGNIWSEATLPEPLLEVLVTAYFGRPRPVQVARARLFALVAKYGWTLWAAIQDGASAMDFDFWSWGMQKYERAVAEFDGPELADHLAIAGRAE